MPTGTGNVPSEERVGNTGFSSCWEMKVLHDLADILPVLGFSLKIKMPYQTIELHCNHVWRGKRCVSFSFPSRVMGCAPRHCGLGAFPGKEISVKIQLDPFSGNGAGGRELLLPISMC